MARNNQRGRNNNNPQGHNQYSNGWLDTARERPFVAAATAAAAVGTGIFLWSRRNEISDQISELSGQISDWASEMRNGSGDNRELALTGGPNESSAIESSRSTGRSGGSRSRSTASSGSASSVSGTQANQTTGGRSQGENTTF
jgi:hypothetical protein